MELENLALLSEDEKIVRTYKCTRIRRFLSKGTTGYLTITNKRLVYHSKEKRPGNDNTLISEMPIDDVGGISTYVGRTLNILYMLLASVGFYLGTMILKVILPHFLTGWAISIIFVLPYVIGLLFEQGILSKEIGDRIVKNLEGTSVDTLIKKKDTTFYMSIFRILFIIGFAFLAWNLVNETDLVYYLYFFRYVILFGAYVLLYLMIFGRYRVFGLQISSKSAGTSGIIIYGLSYLAIFNRYNTTAKSISAGPAEDSETISRELGALVMDIQQMGDLGIEKWSSAS